MIKKEYQQQLRLLNQSVADWIEKCLQDQPVSIWKEAARDYVVYAEQLRKRFGAVLDDPLNKRTLFSFGSGDCGQLGHGIQPEADSDNDGGDDSEEGGGGRKQPRRQSEDTEVKYPRKVQKIENESVLAICAGGLHNQIVTTNGEVYSFGCSDDGTLGRDGDENYPAKILSTLSRKAILQVSAGDSHSLFLSIQGEVFMCGTYKDKDSKPWVCIPGREGGGDQSMITQPTIVLVNATMIASGSQHSAALVGEKGQLFTWGIGEMGELGRQVGQMKDEKGVYRKTCIYEEHCTPKQAQCHQSNNSSSTELVSNARYIACGEHHSFYISALSCKVYASGLNQYSQCGITAGEPIKIFEHMESLNGINVAEIAGGAHFSACRTFEGKVYTWGRCDQAQLGITLPANSTGPGAFISTPQLVNEAALKYEKVQSISCGNSHMATITKSGTLITWGFGTMLALGNGIEQDEPLPYKVNLAKSKINVKTESEAVDVACGGQHTLLVIGEKEESVNQEKNIYIITNTPIRETITTT